VGSTVLLPAETSKFATISPSGQVELGQNVVLLRPEAPVAGYVPADDAMKSLEHVSGDGSGQVLVEIIDPLNIRENHTYEISFEDDGEFSAQTNSFSVVDITGGINDTVVNNSEKLDVDATIVDGVTIHIMNDDLILTDKQNLRWLDSTRNILRPALWDRFAAGATTGKPYPANYQAEVSEMGADSSAAFRFGQKVETDFRIKNTSEDRFIRFDLFERGKRRIPSGFDPEPPEKIGRIDENDIIILYELDTTNYQLTFQFTMDEDTTAEDPQSGDVLILPVSKPFLDYDAFQYTVTGPKEDKSLAKNELDAIRVVPNPYVAAASWEQKNSFSSGRGERSIHFIGLPRRCTIRIYTVRGELVETIEHNSVLTNGTADWDLLSQDQLSVAYGIYIYHIDAPGIGEKIGRFAVIK
jgi:hypothetical protein